MVSARENEEQSSKLQPEKLALLFGLMTTFSSGLRLKFTPLAEATTRH
jgi:hypothetical protein